MHTGSGEGYQSPIYQCSYRLLDQLLMLYQVAQIVFRYLIYQTKAYPIRPVLYDLDRYCFNTDIAAVGTLF